MKRVLMMSYDHIYNPYYGGGGAAAIHELAKALGKWYEITVLTAPFKGSRAGTNKIDNVAYVPMGPRIAHPQLSQLTFLIYLMTEFKNYPFEVIIESLAPPFTGTLIPRLTSRPVIGLVHLLSGRIMADKYESEVFIKIETWLLSGYKVIVALTPTSKRKIAKIAPKALVTVIPNGVNIPPNKDINKRSGWLYLGRIDERQKALKLLIRAFELSAAKSDWDLTIAGSGTNTEVANLRQLIAASSYGTRVHYYGQVQGKQKEKLLRNAGAMILTSRFETQPLSILEAFAYGCPVIYPAIDDLKYLPNKIAWPVKRSPKEIAAAMTKVAAKQKEVVTRAKKAREYVESYRWEKVAEKYYHLIEGLR